MSSSQEHHTATKPRRKKEAPGFLHDSNARNDQKILRLRARGGWAYFGLYWACIEVMRESADYAIDVEALEGLALSFAMTAADLEAFLQAACAIGLFELEDGKFFSRSLIERMERYEDALEQRRNAGRASAERRSNARSTVVASSFNVPNKNQNNNYNQNQNENQNGEVQEGEPPDPAPGAIAQPCIPLPGPAANGPAPADPAIEHPDPLVVQAESFLKPIADVCLSAIYHSTGRRPMRKHPHIWITPTDLADAIRQCSDAGIPLERMRDLVFKPVESQLVTDAGAGKDTSRLNAYLKITSWGLNNALKRIQHENDLQRSEAYKAKARTK